MTSTDPVLRALAHPVRLRMMSLMWAGPLSAAELSRELAISHALASQHLRKLAEAGLAELAEVRPHRGGRERRYRAVRGAPLTERSDPETAPVLAEMLAAMLRVRAAARADGPGTTADVELWVDPARWDEFRNALSGLLEGLHEAALPPRTPGAVRVAATVMAFRMLEGGAGTRSA